MSNFTEPTIVTTNDIKHRSFISFYYNGKPQRQYNGNAIGKIINPNRASTLNEKLTLLNRLRFEIHKALEAGNYTKSDHNSSAIQTKQVANNPQANLQPAIKHLYDAVKVKIRSNLSKKYKRNLKTIYRQFKQFMSAEELARPLNTISTFRVEAFLNQFSSTGTYYMNKRRDLGVLFNSAGRAFEQPVATVTRTAKRKAKSTLHKPYDKHQVKPILEYLEVHNFKLYICCLLTYGSWLRPHEEIRLLTLNNFTEDLTEIRLSGNENKGGKVRVVYVPEYTKKVIAPILSKLSRNENIFTCSNEVLNESYFNTAWSRAYRKMFANGLVYEGQTIYSFRHTAAIDTYRKKKDVYLLQKLLDHSSIMVTLKYLRSLGEFNSDELRDAAPQL